MLKNTPNSFGSIAKTFHWVLAFGIVGMLTVGFIMTDMAPSPSKWVFYGLHKSTGTLILLLVILRAAWRLLNHVPQPPRSLKPWHRRLAKLSPLALYILMLMMPLSGLILSQAGGHPISVYNLFTLPALFSKNSELSTIAVMVHTYGAYAFVGALALHISAAFYHHFILKTNILKKMLPNWLGRP